MKFTYKILDAQEIESQKNQFEGLNIVKGVQIDLEIEDFFKNATSEEFEKALDAAGDLFLEQFEKEKNKDE